MDLTPEKVKSNFDKGMNKYHGVPDPADLPEGVKNGPKSAVAKPKATPKPKVVGDVPDGTFFGGKRDDNQLALTVAADLQDFPARRWTLTPRVRYMKNDSNISLYEYDRFEAVVYLRRGF